MSTSSLPSLSAQSSNQGSDGSFNPPTPSSPVKGYLLTVDHLTLPSAHGKENHSPPIPVSPSIKEPRRPISPAPEVTNVRTTSRDIAIIREVRVAVAQWTKHLGPVDDWGRVFRKHYDEACCDTTSQSTQDSIDVFLRGVMDHVKMGRSILKSIEDCQVVRDPLVGGDAGDRLLAGDVISTLHRGIAILEARLEIHAPSGPCMTDLHSNIRRYQETLDS